MSFIIEKVISIAAPNQLSLFQNFLASRNYLLPLSLIKTIEKFPNETSLFYSKKIYGNEKPESLKNLNQLAHHTFKLSAFFSQNFSNYLLYPFQRIDVLLFENKKSEALEVIILIKDVAEKLEDFSTLSKLYDIIRQHFFAYSKTLPKNYLQDALQHQKILLSIIKIQDDLVRNMEHSSSKNIQKELAFFKQHFGSKTKSIQLIAKQSYLNLLSHFNHKEFYLKETLHLIKSTSKEIENHPYLLITKYSEKMMTLDYMYLKHTRLVLDEKEMNAACSKIIRKWRTFYSTENRIDTGLFLALSIQGSYLITNYYYNKINSTLTQNINETVDLCESLLHKIDWDKEGFLKHINFCNVYAIFLILSNQDKKAIKLIESMLHQYQQKSFKKLYDGLFVILIMGYLKTKQFDEVVTTYSRYKKLTKDEISIVENDLIIKSMYYVSQLKIQKKKQFQQKLDSVIAELRKDVKLKNNLLLVERIINSVMG